MRCNRSAIKSYPRLACFRTEPSNAALFLAIGVMFYRARHARPSATRRAMTGGFIVGCLILAVLGFSEWINGNAGPGILLAVATETVLGLAFIQAHRSSVTQTQAST